MVKKYNILIEVDEEGWFVSEVIGLPGCHSQAKTKEELIERTKEAIRGYLAEEKEPLLTDTFIGVQEIEV